MPDLAFELRIDARTRAGLAGRTGVGRIEQVEQSLPDEHVLGQRHRTVFVDDHRGVTADRLDPVAELLGVAHRRRQTDDPHRRFEVQDHLFPHRPAEPVRQEVDLVHDDVGQTVQGP